MTTEWQKSCKPLHFEPLLLLIKNETSHLAPIVPRLREEILLCRGSAQKIETDSGTRRLLNTKFTASKKT
ncbi:hypothetical protein ASC72_22880 [Flavobacterium sp. Root420]|nr:hypothetical protein ASC72_22880 [Flavobacterium sp. Root420]